MTTAIPPSLYDLFGALMLCVAAYCATLLIISAVTSQSAGRDVEISHLFMGVAMSGMFVARWAFGSSAVWEIVFGILAVWFAAQCVQSLRRYGPHLPHAAIHAVMNVAMVLMYWFPMESPRSDSMSGSGAIAMSASSHGSRLDPSLAFVVAVACFASAVFTLASPQKGASHFGSHSPAHALADSVGGDHVSVHLQPSPGSADAVQRVVAAPWLLDLNHVAMCVAMGFMLLLVN